jgi:hypothetical protein
MSIYILFHFISSSYASLSAYLTALGAVGVLKASKQAVGLDELFVMEDSHPQVKLLAFNNRRVSVRSGQEVSANQDDVTDAEFFQLEIDTETKLVWNTRSFSVCVCVCLSLSLSLSLSIYLLISFFTPSCSFSFLAPYVHMRRAARSLPSFLPFFLSFPPSSLFFSVVVSALKQKSVLDHR